MPTKADLDDRRYLQLPTEMTPTPAVIDAHARWMDALDRLPDFDRTRHYEFSRAVLATRAAFLTYLRVRDAAIVLHYLHLGHTCTPQEAHATREEVFYDERGQAQGMILFGKRSLLHCASILTPQDVAGFPYFFLVHSLDQTEGDEKPFICAYDTLLAAQDALAVRFVIVERPKP